MIDDFNDNPNIINLLTYMLHFLQIYLMDFHIWYTLLSAIIGGVMGARARLGEVIFLTLTPLSMKYFLVHI